MTEGRAQFGVLGAVELVIDGVGQALGGPKQRAVLAYLVINANRPVSVEALAQAVWEDSPPPDIRVSLHTIVSNLRKPLRDNGIDARSVLAQVGPGYRVTVAEGASDVQRFRERKEAGLRALSAGQFRMASELLSSALGQWRGPVLADLRGLGFADGYATVLDDDRLTAIEARAEADIAQGRADVVVSELGLLVGEYPLREPLWAQLITALYVDGRQSDALDATRRLRAILADQLGIDPSLPIRELEARILRQDPLDSRAQAAAASIGATTIVEQSAGEQTALLRERSGQTYTVSGTVTRVGRLPDNDIVLEHGKVSRHHAAIMHNGITYLIKDLLSSNGVFVDGMRIVDAAVLIDGAVIRIGDYELTFTLVPLDSAG
ncbi:BTAD domain-containing putative transcriptional regulator [Nocardia sp. NPDC050175]|uniref:BTAD domain-containing putative transcriptional regulator n=1 Tax=Nocardia sp. NPDC050175 TaxID=3364317 RepID=UPI0037B1B72B